MKTLILGSAGQVGSALKQYLGDDAIDYDIVYQPIEQDLRNKNNTQLLFEFYKPDLVYFLAFDVGGSRYLKEYQHTYDFIDNNIQIMANTFEALRYYKMPFIFASSQMSNMSHSPYGVLKLLGEYYTKSLGGLTAKLWNVFGKENDPAKTHVITDLIQKGYKNQSIDVASNGLEHRQFLYVEDCCKALHALSKNYHQLDKNKPYHISSFKWHSIRDVANIISEKMGGLPITYAEEVDMVQQDIKNEPDPYILKYWKPPENTLENGIEALVKEYGTIFKSSNQSDPIR